MRNAKLTTKEDLLKIAREQILTDQVRAYDEVVVRCLFDELKYRQKRNVKKKSNNHYQDWLYYIAYDGRLARVPNTAKNPMGLRLVKNKTIRVDEWGLLRADDEISGGQFVRIRPLLKELDPRDHWTECVKEKIAKYLEGGKECTMVIDRDFLTAYEPDYDDDFCLDGDLVTGQSCMSGQGECAEEFYGGIDGCYVCRFENAEGEQVGRCIMYEYKGQRHFIRIYAYRDYARCALRLLRKEMREDDLFGRSECIEGMKLSTNWTSSTPTMYLDGRAYGLDVRSMSIVESSYDVDLKETGNEELGEYLNDCEWEICENCGEWFSRDDGFEVNGYYYCCEDCASSDGCVCCANCGQWSRDDGDGHYAPDGEWYCCNSCLRDEGYVVCENCGEVVSEEDAIQIGYNWYCNEDCASSDGWEKCSNCGEWNRGMFKIAETGDLICKDCAGERGLELMYVKKQETTQETEVKNDEKAEC